MAGAFFATVLVTVFAAAPSWPERELTAFLVTFFAAATVLPASLRAVVPAMVRGPLSRAYIKERAVTSHSPLLEV